MRHLQLKSFIAKRVNSILVNLRYLGFKLLKYKENNKKICNTFDHNFKNIPLYIMRKVSLERYYFVLYNGALTLKMSKMVLNPFCDKTLQLVFSIRGKTDWNDMIVLYVCQKPKAHQIHTSTQQFSHYSYEQSYWQSNTKQRKLFVLPCFWWHVCIVSLMVTKYSDIELNRECTFFRGGGGGAHLLPGPRIHAPIDVSPCQVSIKGIV